MKGVWFHQRRQGWICVCHVNGKQHRKVFPISRYQKAGVSWDEASNFAYRDAAAYRRAMEDSGMCRIKPGPPLEKKQRSAMKGVWFDRFIQRWVCCWYINGKRHYKDFLIRRYHKAGVSWDEASDFAYRDAAAYRRAMEDSRKCRIKQKTIR